MGQGLRHEVNRIQYRASFAIINTSVLTRNTTLPDAHAVNRKITARLRVGRRIDTAKDVDSAMISFQTVRGAFLPVVIAAHRWALDYSCREQSCVGKRSGSPHRDAM